MMNWPWRGFGTAQAVRQLEKGAAMGADRLRFYEHEVRKWKESRERAAMIQGERYYFGKQDILQAKRLVIGKGGELEEVDNLPNNHIVDNQYAIAVDKKVNYLVGKPLTFDVAQDSDRGPDYPKQLKYVLGRRFYRTLLAVSYDVVNTGWGWVYPHYSEDGELLFQRLRPWDVKPFWKDADKTVLDEALHLYEIEHWDGRRETTKEFVEIFRADGIYTFELAGSRLVPAEQPFASYICYACGEAEHAYNWERVPLVAFRSSLHPQSLLRRVKSLQDAINTILSNFMNNMEEDVRNTILVLVNYEGTDLGEFRQNLSQYGVVKVRTVEGVSGDLRALQVTVNADNYKAILNVLKNALIENARSFDAKDDRLTSGTANQMNIQSMYSDIDLDANGMETEYQASMEELLWFVDAHIANNPEVGMDDSDVDVVFNRDILINEGEAIDNVQKSAGILSEETLVAQHPWVDDPENELARKRAEEAEQQKRNDPYRGVFPAAPPGGDEEGGEVDAKQ